MLKLKIIRYGKSYHFKADDATRVAVFCLSCTGERRRGLKTKPREVM